MDYENRVVPQDTKIIPEYIETRGGYYPLGPGLLAKGDRVRVRVTVTDKDGTDKLAIDDKYILREYPKASEKKELVGRVMIDFSESPLPV